MPERRSWRYDEIVGSRCLNGLPFTSCFGEPQREVNLREDIIAALQQELALLKAEAAARVQVASGQVPQQDQVSVECQTEDLESSSLIPKVKSKKRAAEETLAAVPAWPLVNCLKAIHGIYTVSAVL